MIWFVLPALLINLGVILVPALLTVLMAFSDWNGVGRPGWAGLANVRSVLSDPVFTTALGNNLEWTAIFLTVPIAMGLFAAACLLAIRRGQTVLQAVLFLPVIIATVITGRVWQGMIYNPGSGLFSWLKLHGIAVSDPLSLPRWALLGVATVDVWHWWGFLAVIFLAAMRQVDAALIEAARLDGAGFLATLRFILLPAIRPTVLLMMVMTVIWSFLTFDFVYVLTQGGPAFSSEVLSTLAYRHAFYDFAIGPAAVVALVIGLFGFAATAAYLWLQRDELAA